MPRASHPRLVSWCAVGVVLGVWNAGSATHAAAASAAMTSVNQGPTLTNPGDQATAIAPGYAPAVFEDGAVAYWRFDDPSGLIATDRAPSPHSGTLAGGVTLNQTGPQGTTKLTKKEPPSSPG